MATLTRDEGGGVKAFIAEAWTLEFDLALQPALAADVHLAVQLAKTTSRNPAWLEKIRLEAAQAYADWKRQGLSDVEIAVNIFRPVHDKAASKAARNGPQTPCCSPSENAADDGLGELKARNVGTFRSRAPERDE